MVNEFENPKRRCVIDGHMEGERGGGGAGRKLSENILDFAVAHFSILISSLRCGKCSSCMMVDCGACKICQMNQDPSKQGWCPLVFYKNIKLTNTGSPFKYVCLNRRPCESPVNPDKVEANGGEEKVAKTTASSNISIIAGILYTQIKISICSWLHSLII